LKHIIGVVDDFILNESEFGSKLILFCQKRCYFVENNFFLFG